MTHQNALSLVALAVAASLSSQAFAASHKADEVMVVSGSRMEQKLEDVSGPISVITAKQIEEQVVTNVADLFRYEPGVAINGGSHSSTDGQTFSLRGMGGNRVKVVSDGVRQNDAYGEGGVGQNYFDTDMIKQVEIVKGPASTAYGSDAIGGVIAITTKDASDFLRNKDSYVDVTSSYASENGQWMGGFTTALRTGDFEHLLRYTQRNGGVKQNYQSSLYDFDIVDRSVLLKSKWHISAVQQAQLTFDYYDQDKESDPFANSKDLRLKDEKSENYRIMLDHQVRSNAALTDSITSKIYVSKFDQKNNKENGNKYNGKAEYNTFVQDALGAQVQFDKRLGANSIAWGLEYEKSATERKKNSTRYPSGITASTNAFPDSNTRRAAIWFFDNIELSDKWLLTPGLRYDHYELEASSSNAKTSFETIKEGEFSPKLGLIYKANELAHLYAQYSHGFRAPTYSEAFASGGYSYPGFTHTFIQNADLHPESSDGIDLGIRGQSDFFDYDLSVFKTRYKDFIDAENTNPTGSPTNMVTQYVNKDKVNANGAELKLGYWFNDDIYTWGALSYISGKDQNGNYINSLNPLSGNIGVRFEQALWNFNTALRFADDMDKVGKDDAGKEFMKSSGWGVVDMYAQFKPLPQLQLNVGVFNLFDREYTTYNRLAGKDARTDVSTFTEPGRNLSARVKYVF
ncbi:ligand-gated channel protein [Aeromonas sobria]|uniref:TonB-dependent hemoglobin/transferrin/lactoferrin family receptor n=1 Tax=Aeromonas sobria TaxID=646 RepID=UPI0011187726|nr:TonB-dependent hemoglobin/transferrin/lactoferrin family receptor [Aeromonas sobria]TNJ15276.1 ligand-gated channel protein [Aeromonas sobria]